PRAFCRPAAWSHVIPAAVPLSAAALHVSRRRLIQPGEAGSTNVIRLRTYSAYDTTVMCTPYDTEITGKSGPAAYAVSGTDGLRCSSRIVRYTEASTPANTELLSILRYRTGYTLPATTYLLPPARYTRPNARRHRGEGHSEYAPLVRLQRHRARRSRDQ